MNSTAAGPVPERRRGRRLAGGVTSVALTAAGLTGLGLTTAPAHAEDVSITNAELRWELNKESTSGAFAPGSWNLFSAGKLGNPGEGGQMLTAANEGATWGNAEPAGWKNAEGNVTVLDKQPDGSYAPTTWQGTRTNASGTPVNTSTVQSENLLSLTNGTGEVDPDTDTGTVAWDGDFTVVYYSGMSFFYVSDPTLTVTDGVGKVTATLSGYGSDMGDMTKWLELPPTQVTLADLHDVDLTEDGLTVTPDYLGVAVTPPANGSPQVTTGAHFGSFPQSFVDFQGAVGTASYWYSSGGAADVRKPTTPMNVTWSSEVAPAVPSVTVSDTTLLPSGAQQVTVEGSGFDPEVAVGTRPPLMGKPAGAYVVFGKFAESWKPSEGAPSANRVNSSQKWAVRAEDMATIGGEPAGAIELRPDGTFTATLTVDKAAIDAKAAGEHLVNYGIYTYPGSGAVNSGYETYTPITFAQATPKVSIASTRAVYGKATAVTVAVSGESTADGDTVTLKRGTTTVGTKALTGGRAAFSLPKSLRAGTHTLTASYAGNVNVAASTAKRSLTVAKAAATVRVKVVRNPTRARAGRLRVTVVTSPVVVTAGKVTVTVRNTKGKVVRIVRGRVGPRGVALLSLPKANLGRYTLRTTYAGTPNIKAAVRTGRAFRVRR